MRIVKLVIGVALVALLIVVAAAAIFLLTFDANENKQSITNLVKKQTGRELVLDGDIGFSVFPKIAITLGPAQLSNAQGFTADSFARVEKATASVKLLPLFTGDIQVDTVELQGLQVNLEIKASGKTNWDDLVQSEVQASEAKDVDSSEGLAISIGGIQISDAQVHYVDHKAKSTLRIDLVELKTGALGRGDKTHIHSVLRVQQDDTRLQLVLDTQARTDFVNMQYQLQGLVLDITAHMAGLPNGQVALQITADGSADLKQESLSLDRFVLALDQDVASGALHVKSFTQPNVRFVLSSKELNLDRWLATDEPVETAVQTKSDDLIVLPTEMLRSLNLLGEIDVAKLNISGLSLENLKSKLTAKSGVLEIQQLDADFYQGHINARAKLDVSKSRPSYVASSVLKDIQLAPLMRDAMATKKPMLRGVAMAQFAVNSRGERVSQLRKNLGGDLSFKVSDGALVSKGLTRALEQAAALLKGRSPKPSGEEVLLKEVSASATIVSGLLQNDDLKLQTPLLDGHGRGQVNMANSTIDYRLKMGLPGSTDKVGLPIRVRGPLTDMQYSVDMKDALKGKANDLVDKKKKKVEKKIQEKIQEKTKGLLGDKLKKLF